MLPFIPQNYTKPKCQDYYHSITITIIFFGLSNYSIRAYQQVNFLRDGVLVDHKPGDFIAFPELNERTILW